MKSLIKLYARPKLNSPNMLNFKELGEIEASNFFDPIGVLAKDSVVEAPQFPQSKFYYLKNKGAASDTILFIGDDQPATKGYELANCVVDVALKFQVKRIYTCAAALTRIHHTEPPRVWGVVTNPDMTPDLEKYGLRQKGNLHVSGLNGLLLGVAKERDIEGVCLLGEVPMYATRIQSPMAALVVLKVLTKILGVEIDMAELARVASETKERMKQVAAEAMGEYIDHFTTPIWEYGEEEEEE